MSDSKRDDLKQLQEFIAAYLEGLQRLPEDEVVGGLPSTSTDRARFAQLVQNAKAAAGQRRLRHARRTLDRHDAAGASNEVVDLEEARRFIAEAVNDDRFTLAARDLINMSDGDVLRIYRQLMDLGIRRVEKKP